MLHIYARTLLRRQRYPIFFSICGPLIKDHVWVELVWSGELNVRDMQTWFQLQYSKYGKLPQNSHWPVFTKILILRISLILRIFLRSIIFLRKILRIRMFLFTKILILRIILILRMFLRIITYS